MPSAGIGEGWDGQARPTLPGGRSRSSNPVREGNGELHGNMFPDSSAWVVATAIPGLRSMRYDGREDQQISKEERRSLRCASVPPGPVRFYGRREPPLNHVPRGSICAGSRILGYAP